MHEDDAAERERERERERESNPAALLLSHVDQPFVTS
jgi:hypothetical protein